MNSYCIKMLIIRLEQLDTDTLFRKKINFSEEDNSCHI